jgi:hypothetical protein
LKKRFKVEDENVYNLGDEIDCYWMNSYGGVSINAQMTALQEIEFCKIKLRTWAKYFPIMKLCFSNHVRRIWKKASHAQVPSAMLKSYKDIIDAPPNWTWANDWKVKGSQGSFLLQHGDGYSGINGHRSAAICNGANTIIGHLHSNAGLSYVWTRGQKIWGMNAGCLLDEDAYVFEYGKFMKFRPVLGCAVVLDGGKTPIWIPLQ